MHVLNKNIKAAEQILIDNGIEPDEASTVLQAIGYALCNEELYGESWTAYAFYDDNMYDLSTYDDKDEAIQFAKECNWDEVINDITGEIVWKR